MDYVAIVNTNISDLRLHAYYSLVFIRTLEYKGWALQHAAYGDGKKWPEGYVRHTRIYEQRSEFLIREHASKNPVWGISITRDDKAAGGLSRMIAVRVECSEREDLDRLLEYAHQKAAEIFPEDFRIDFEAR